MKPILKKMLLAVGFLLCSLGVYAHDFEVDGIYYQLLSEENQVAVTYYGDDEYNVPDEYKYTGAVTIPEAVTYQGATYSVTSIEMYAFYYCTGLTEIIIPNSVTSIGGWAFCYCTNLISIVISESITEIEPGVFSGCTGLTEIIIPSGVTSIGHDAFYGCKGLTEIIIPSGVTSIGHNAFYGCEGLTSMVVEEGNTVYDSRENCSAIIETASNTLVAGCMNTTIPNSVTSIGDSAFRGCYALTEITIPNSVTEIGDHAFYCCYALTEITIPNSVTELGDHAFYCCYALTEITIPNSVTSIGESAFRGCYALTEITIPNSVTSIGESAFRGCSGLTSICIEAVNPPVIEENTFKEVDKSIPLYLPMESVEAYRTAEYWSEFTNIVGYTELAEGDKFTADGIHYQVLPESGQVAVTYYGDDFSNVPEEYKYTGAVTIPEVVTYQGATYSVTSIDDAFFKCTGLTEINIPNSVTSIGDYAFYECDGLTSVTIPNSVTTIGYEAFSGCDGLTEITIPNSVTSIGSQAFEGCTGMTEMRVEAINPPTIYDDTFDEVDKSIPVYVPAESVEAYRTVECWSEFTNIVGYTELAEGDKFTVDGIYYQVLPESGQVAVTYYGDDKSNVPDEYKYTGAVTIPEVVTYQGLTYNVTEITDYAFFECTGLTTITIPNSVNSIGYSAFYRCTGLTSVTIPNSVTRIGDDAFFECSGLTSVTIPNSVTEIDYNAFRGCTGLTSIVVVEGNTVYDSRENCNAIIETATNTLVAGCKNTTIPNSVTSIGYSAFYRCTGLTSVTIPNSVTSIGMCAFSGCNGLTEVTIPNSVTSIGVWAFYYCTGLTEIIIPNSVTEIGDYAFEDCTGLTSVTIPNSVTSIGERAFWDCTGLTSVTIGNSVTTIDDYAFENCTGLTEVTIPNSVTSIGVGAFESCTGLTSMVVEEGNTVYDSRENCNAIIETASNTLVAGCKNTTIPNNVTLIGVRAFRGCTGLTSVTIPNSVTEIDGAAFSWCAGLTEMRVEAVNPPTIYNSTFEEVDKSIPLYVPAESVEAYRTAEYWSEFTNILSIPVENPGEPSANRLQADDVTVAELDGILSQARVALPIVLVNEDAISAVQCDIYLPAGLSIATTESGMDITLSDRVRESHTLMTNTLANGAMRIVIMSASAEALTGNEGTLFTLGLLPNENYNTESQIVIRNITMTDTDIVEYTPEQVVVNCRIRQSILGDANRDNKINVTDIVLLAKYILNDYHGDFDALAGDVNQDGKINVSDIVAMANKILSGEGAAGAPTRQEGEKGTLRMDEVQINGEHSAIASLMLDNSVSYSAFQMDVILPDGVEIAAIERSERISEHHQLMWNVQADGRVRILVFAIDNSVIAAQEGALFDMQLRAQSGFTAGELQVTDATFVTRGTTTHHIDDLAVGVSRTSDLTGNHVANRVYATGRTLVIESSESQEARITTADGLSQSIALQPGRNEYPMTQQGVYIVTLGNENKKVIVK